MDVLWCFMPWAMNRLSPAHAKCNTEPADFLCQAELVVVNLVPGFHVSRPSAALCGWRWCRSSWPSGWSPPHGRMESEQDQILQNRDDHRERARRDDRGMFARALRITGAPARSSQQTMACTSPWHVSLAWRQRLLWFSRTSSHRHEPLAS